MRRLPQPGRFAARERIRTPTGKDPHGPEIETDQLGAQPRMRGRLWPHRRTAHLCAAALTGEKPTDDPSSNASPQALMQAMGMIWFLARIDPADLTAFTTGPGSLADIAHGPLPVSRAPRKAVFAQMFQ